MKVKYLTRVRELSGLSADEMERLEKVTERFAFRCNEYYLSLINWDDPKDPIRRIVVPCEEELEEWGDLDASKEKLYTIMPGLQHKYRETAVLLVNDVCGSFCRFCFRKRLFRKGVKETTFDVSAAVEYIKEHPEANNVLLTGGDPLLLSTSRLRKIIHELSKIDSVHIIRIGTKIPAYNPYRIVDDPELIDMVGEYSKDGKRIYIIAHFNHPRELTDVAVKGIRLFQGAGASVYNQTPLLRGVNDNPTVLTELFNRLSFLGVTPYYVFQCRPTLGNRPYVVPVEEAFSIVTEAQRHCAGLAKTARYVMSHKTGKIQVLAVVDGKVCFKYHQAADVENVGKFMLYRSNPNAYWFDDYKERIA